MSAYGESPHRYSETTLKLVTGDYGSIPNTVSEYLNVGTTHQITLVIHIYI